MNELMIPKPSQLITNTMQCTEYNLYLHGAIGSADDFMEHFAVYKQAGEGDVVRLYVNSEGGSLSTGMQYIAHMRECSAPIIAVLGVEVASMASAIVLEADEIQVDDMTTMLIHSFSYGAAGSESSIYNQAIFNKKLNERWIRKHYSSFLTEEQLIDVFKGVDILLDSDEIKECWEVMKLAREEQGCGREDCEDCNPSEEESFNIHEMIKEAVTEAISDLRKDFDIVPKEKPATKRKSRAKSPEKVVD